MQPTRTHDAAQALTTYWSHVLFTVFISMCVLCGGDVWQEESKQHIKWLRSVKTVRWVTYKVIIIILKWKQMTVSHNLTTSWHSVRRLSDLTSSVPFLWFWCGWLLKKIIYLFLFFAWFLSLTSYLIMNHIFDSLWWVFYLVFIFYYHY